MFFRDRTAKGLELSKPPYLSFHVGDNSRAYPRGSYSKWGQCPSPTCWAQRRGTICGVMGTLLKQGGHAFPYPCVPHSGQLGPQAVACAPHSSSLSRRALHHLPVQGVRDRKSPSFYESFLFMLGFFFFFSVRIWLVTLDTNVLPQGLVTPAAVSTVNTAGGSRPKSPPPARSQRGSSFRLGGACLSLHPQP